MNATVVPVPRIARELLTFEADWMRVLFVHFEITPEVLQPHIPVPLDLHEGKAYISLLQFSFERLRFAGTGLLGRCLCRPLSEHAFLNVRTYVRGAAGPGIFFIAEWINNPLSLRIGPVSHGLPYRLGRFEIAPRRSGGTSHLRVTDRFGHGDLRITFPSATLPPPAHASAGTLDAFLVERYRAYTARAGIIRTFEVEHEPWLLSRLDWIRTEAEMLNRAFPWFPAANLISAHTCPGLENVTMGPPSRVSPSYRVSTTEFALDPSFAT